MATTTPTIPTAPAPVQPITFTVLESPAFLQSSGNPIRVRTIKTPFRIGEMFFLEIWLVPGKHVLSQDNTKIVSTLYQTLTKNGPGDGTCSFDISSILATTFQSATIGVPDPQLVFQKDPTAYQGYYLKAGYLTYNAQNQQVRNYKWESDVCYAIRAALDSQETGDMSDFYYRFDGETHRYLTRIPDGATRRPSETTYLSFFHAQNPSDFNPVIDVVADLHFNTGAVEEAFPLFSAPLDENGGGLYLLNVAPQALVAHPQYSTITKYSVYLQYTSDTYDEETGVEGTQTQTITQSREFIIGKDIDRPNTIQFANRLGGWDSIQFRRDSLTEIKTKSQSFTSSLATRTYQIDSQTSVTYHSSWLNPDEFKWLKDLVKSPAIYINGSYHRMSDMAYKLDSSLGLFTLDITVSPDSEENGITL